ncbi:hypothetical protein K1W54_23910 [Micromonospora sp. CPCC 205371]|nr:hypothetical protein [Micromonospora sp. CPCC 205371]
MFRIRPEISGFDYLGQREIVAQEGLTVGPQVRDHLRNGLVYLTKRRDPPPKKRGTGLFRRVHEIEHARADLAHGAVPAV